MNITEESTLVRKQVKIFGPRSCPEWNQNGCNAYIKAEVRFDDECGNGHNSLAITGEIYITGRRNCEAWGCLHEEIAKYFPELAPFLKWHLCSTDGPMHYIANTIYNASNRDCWGKLKGEPKTFAQGVAFGDNPIVHELKSQFSKFLWEAGPKFDLEVIQIEHDKNSSYKFAPKFTFGGYGTKWYECPFDSEAEAVNFLRALQTCSPKFISTPDSFGEGKEREFDAARASAIWPEATDEELSLPAPELRAELEARLPGLLAEFRKAVESLGFVW